MPRSTGRGCSTGSGRCSSTGGASSVIQFDGVWASSVIQFDGFGRVCSGAFSRLLCRSSGAGGATAGRRSGGAGGSSSGSTGSAGGSCGRPSGGAAGRSGGFHLAGVAGSSGGPPLAARTGADKPRRLAEVNSWSTHLPVELHRLWQVGGQQLAAVRAPPHPLRPAGRVEAVKARGPGRRRQSPLQPLRRHRAAAMRAAWAAAMPCACALPGGGGAASSHRRLCSLAQVREGHA